METAQPRTITSPGASLVWKAEELSTDQSLPAEVLKKIIIKLAKTYSIKNHL